MNQKWLTLVGLVVLLLVGVIVYSALQDQKGTDTSTLESVRSLPDDPLAAGSFEAQVDETGPVTVTIQPLSLTDSGTWDFVVTLQTHSVDLDMDILTSIVLLDSAGEEVSPISWDGDPPEGHHRTGTLSFTALNPKPETVTVLAKNIADVPLREFVWKN